MRAPQVLLMSVLIPALSLLATGQDETSTAPTVVQWVNAKYADPKPCSNGWHIALDAVGNPVNSLGAEATTKTPQPPIGRLAAGIPAVPINPPTLIFPPSRPEPMKLRYVYFETFFYEVGIYNRWAEQAEKAGKHAEAAAWRTSHQRTAGLNDAEGEVLQEIAHDCTCAVNELDAKMSASAEKFRAQIVPGATVNLADAEFDQMFEDRKATVIGHVEQLRIGLGDASFKKLETYVLSMYPAPESKAKPEPPFTTEKVRTDNK
jgi:hypothetical protein